MPGVIITCASTTWFEDRISTIDNRQEIQNIELSLSAGMLQIFVYQGLNRLQYFQEALFDIDRSKTVIEGYSVVGNSLYKISYSTLPNDFNGPTACSRGDD
jgi:hypothetical protein